MKKYTLTFYEALDYLVKEDGLVQGSDFKSGLILKIDDGVVNVADFDGYLWPLHISTGVMSQKYKIIYTQPEANRYETKET